MSNEIQKAQEVRLVDVFVIGPFLMYVSMNESLSGWERSLLFAFGIGTSLYNGKNYLDQQRELEEKEI